MYERQYMLQMLHSLMRRYVCFVLITWPGRGQCLHASMAAVNAINIMQTCVGRQHGEYTDADTAWLILLLFQLVRKSGS